MVCSPPVVSKCLGEAHRRLGIIYINSFFFVILLVISAKRKDESFFKGKALEKNHTRAYNQPQPLSKCLERSRQQIRPTAAQI